MRELLIEVVVEKYRRMVRMESLQRHRQEELRNLLNDLTDEEFHEYIRRTETFTQ